MNIKINIGCDCSPAVITRKEISEVQFKKKNMLYAPPTKDKKHKQLKMQDKNIQNTQYTQYNNQKNQKNQYYNNHQQEQNQRFIQAQKKLVNDLSEISKNQATTDMIQHTNSVLQRQNQILESNQKTIHNLINNNHNNSRRTIDQQNELKSREVKKMFQQSADMIAKEIKEIKKMRDQILQAGEKFKRLLVDGKDLSGNKGPEQIGSMNSNLRNLVEISKNHIQGLENLDGIKNLQNFNIQAYTQAINTLKRQIVQYQKQSENIQRELKLRSAKLQKLQISPNFDEQLLQPYEQYLKKKASNIDLHSIKQRVYEKLGTFDYGKFEYDISTMMNEAKNQMNEFNIICKQYRVEVPDIKIDQKELRQLDLKLPSVLDEFKFSRGIVFNEEINDEKGKRDFNNTKKQPKTSQKEIQKQLIKKPDIQKQTTLKQTQKESKQIKSKPVDYSNEVKLTRLDKEKYTSVLQTKIQKQKKQVQKNIKPKKNEQKDEEFQKYLQNRAREQLALIYEEKKKKLKQMEKQLYETCKEDVKPIYELKLKNKLKVENKGKIQQREQQEDQYEEDFQKGQQGEQQQIKQNKKTKNEMSKEEKQLKSVGTQVLRQKLKNLFTKSNIGQNVPIHNRHIPQQQQQQLQFQTDPTAQMQSMASGFVNMINNTLTQINSQLSSSIQKKMQSHRSLSKQHPVSYQRKVPNQINIPKLQQFRAPPVFNMQMVQEPVYRPEGKKVEKKITAKNYEHLRIKEENDSDLEVSGLSMDD